MNPIVVLDIMHGGYGVVKSLCHVNAPIFGFYNTDFECPERKTRLCRIVTYNDSSLKEELVRIAMSAIKPPVLFLTSDRHVRFIDENRDLLEFFLVSLPDSQSLALINKNAFYRTVQQMGFTVPHTFMADISYPCIVKPSIPNDPRWWDMNPFKAVICHNQNEFERLLGNTPGVEISIQEWIPGPTPNIHFTLVYYRKGECRAEITCQKVREWPTIAGTGCCLRRVENDVVSQMSKRFFDAMGFEGFGSFEFKQHEVTKEWYAIEATIGRVDLNSEFAMIAGMNLPALYYSTLTGIEVNGICLPVGKKYWIHEIMDVQSSTKLLKQKELTMGDLLGTYAASHFHLFNSRDIRPFLNFCKKKIFKNN